jgi:hypothetical protein
MKEGKKMLLKLKFNNTCRNLRALVILFSVQGAVTFTRAFAVPLGDTLDTIQIQETNLFAIQPALISTQKGVVGFEFLLHQNDEKMSDISATQDTKVRVMETHIQRSAGFSVPMGGALGFGVTGTQDNEEVLAKDSAGRFKNSPLQETSWHRAIHAKVVIDFSKSFKVGAGFRSDWTKRTILGSFNLPADETTSLEGNRMGADFGIQTTFAEGGIGLCYLTEMKGKLEVAGENLVNSSPGLVQATGHWNASDHFKLGLALGKYLYAEDELLPLSTGPNPQNRTSISLLGVAPESRYAPTQSIVLSVLWKLHPKISLKASPFYETGEYEIDTKVADPKNRSRVKSDFGGDLAFGFADSNFEISVMHRYFRKKQSFANGNGNERTFESTAQKSSLSAAIMF